MRAALKVLSSLGLSCTLLVLLALLTWLGTLEQVEHGLFDVQKKYFESLFLWHDVGSFAIPLPGAGLVLGLLFVNLTLGGIVRLRKSWWTTALLITLSVAFILVWRIIEHSSEDTSVMFYVGSLVALLFINWLLWRFVPLRKDWSKTGILVTHLGIALMLVSGFVKLYFSHDGHVTLYEGESASAFQSYYRWELVVTEELAGGRLSEYRVPQEDFLDAAAGAPVTLSAAGLPIALELEHFMANCTPLPKGPMFDVDVPVVEGFFLSERKKDAEAERNVAGLYATAVADGRRQTGILWGAMGGPWTFSTPAGRFAVDLRRERYPMPFTVVLRDFTKEDHPGTEMAKAFSSDVTVIEDGSARPVRIEMNQPLRDGGLVLYQASWGPAGAPPGTPLFSTLSVVRNPADQWPLISCSVIAAGLLLHFSRKLVRYVRVEARKA